MMVGPLGSFESYPALQEKGVIEMHLLLDQMEYDGQTSYDYWEDVSGVDIPSLEHLAGFFGLASLIVCYAFVFFYRNGWLLEKDPAADDFLLLITGILLLFLGLGTLAILIYLVICMSASDAIISPSQSDAPRPRRR